MYIGPYLVILGNRSQIRALVDKKSKENLTDFSMLNLNDLEMTLKVIRTMSNILRTLIPWSIEHLHSGPLHYSSDVVDSKPKTQ